MERAFPANGLLQACIQEYPWSRHALQQGIFLIGGQRASILSTLEPITSIVIGFLVFSEPMGIRVISGTVLVVGASMLTALADIINAKKNA